jgi:hypothetical protein
VSLRMVGRVGEINTRNRSHLNTPVYNRLLNESARLSGNARERAYSWMVDFGRLPLRAIRYKEHHRNRGQSADHLVTTRERPLLMRVWAATACCASGRSLQGGRCRLA